MVRWFRKKESLRPYRSDEEIQKMREACLLVSQTLGELAKHIQPGISAAHLDRLAETFIRDHGGIPSFKGYRGYPATICLSINEEIVHGIPSPQKILPEKGLVTIDVGVQMHGYHGDSAYTFVLGNVEASVLELVRATYEALQAGIQRAVPGNRLGDIGYAIQSTAHRYGVRVIRDLVGHGIGTSLHEKPDVPNYGIPGTGERLHAFMTLAIEPMFSLGSGETVTLHDHWTIVTRDGSWSAHFEHTVVVQHPQAEPLTTFQFIHEHYQNPALTR